MRLMGAGFQWWIGTITGGVAAWQFAANSLTVWAWIAGFVALVGFWTAGIASNFALTGEPMGVSDQAARLNVGSALIGVGLLVAALIT